MPRALQSRCIKLIPLLLIAVACGRVPLGLRIGLLRAAPTDISAKERLGEGRAADETGSIKPESGIADVDRGSQVPLYRFDAGYLTKWALLGPIKRGSEPENPLELFGDIRLDKEVTFPDGQVRKWKTWEADKFGVVNLGDFTFDYDYRNQGATPRFDNPAQTVCYACCEIESVSMARQILLGMDDGGRVWLDDDLLVDDVKADWLSLFEHRLPIAETHDKPIRVLMELHNYSGGFQFACYGGVRLERRVVFGDSFAPVAGEVVRVRMPDEPEQITMTDREGVFGARAIPFHAPTTIECLTTTIEVNGDDEMRALPRIDQEIFSVARTTSSNLSYQKLDAPAGHYVAAAETSGGVILLVNETDGVVYAYNGGRVYPHPGLDHFSESPLTNLAVGPDDSIWVGTEDDGVYVWQHDKLIHLACDAELTKGREETVVTAICPVTETEALVSLRNGEGDAGRSRLFRVSTSGKWGEVKLPSGAIILAMSRLPVNGGPPLAQNPAWLPAGNLPPEVKLPNQDEIVLLRQSAKPLLLSGNEIRAIDRGNLNITGMALVGDQCWFAGRSFFSLDSDGTWASIRWPGNPMYKRTEIFQSETLGLLAVCADAIYSVENNMIRRLAIPVNTAERRRSCLASNGKLVVAAGSTGVLIVERKRLVDSSDRGFLSGRAYHVSATEEQVTVSSREPSIGIVSDGVLTKKELGVADDGKIVGNALAPFVCVKHFPGDITIACTTMMQGTGMRINTTLPLYLKTGDSQWKGLRCRAWEEPVNAYFFATQLRDERIVIGTAQGAAELKDSKLVPMDLGRNVAKEGAVAIYGQPNGTLWVATCFKHLVRIREGLPPEVFEIPIKQRCRSTVIVEFARKLLVGTEEGLFEFDKESKQLVPAFGNEFRGRIIVDLRPDIDNENLWVITRHSGVRLANALGELCPIQPFESLKTMNVHGCDVDSAGTLWLASESGAVPFKPTKRKPKLTFDRASGMIERLDTRQFRVGCNESVKLRFATFDDSSQCAVRYRIGETAWRYAETIGNLHTISLRYATSGTHQVEIQALDGEWNFSPVDVISIVSYYPLYQHPATRFLVFAGAVILVAGLILALNRLRRARQAETSVREALYQEEQKARQHAEDASRERELLLARVCHDLRNPLGVVLVATDLFSSGKSDRDKIVKLLRSSTDSMRYLTDQLLKYARLKRRPDMQCVDTALRDFTEKLQAIGELSVLNKPIEFHTEVSTNLPEKLRFDPDLLSEVTKNLVENSVKHTRKGSISVMLAGRKDGLWQVEVRDTGAGIEKDVVTSVFEPFYRGEVSERSKNDKSVGLGLFIARELVTLMGGKIEVSSVVGVGTSVRVVLPYNPPNEGNSPSAAATLESV